MTDERKEEEFVTLWRAQPIEPAPITLEEIRTAATKFERRIRRRNMREYAAGPIAIACFAWGAVSFHGWMTKLGCIEIIAATVFILWHLGRRGSVLATPGGADARGLVEFHRAELVRQRDLVRGVWLWYLAPPIPGFILIFLGRWFQDPVRGRPIATDHLIIALLAPIIPLVLLVIWLLNIIGANRLQKRIDALDGWKARD
jgi:hypothetical protein